MKYKHTILLLALTIVILASGAFTPAAQVYLTLTVNSTGDASDRNPGDLICDISLDPGNQCTLRAAIEEANAFSGNPTPHRIEFNIPGTGPFTIAPNTALPQLIGPAVIDGITQPGASCPTANNPANLQIMLDGINAGYASGLTLSHSTVQGLSIVRFGEHGVKLWFTEGNNVIRCNHIGLDTTGNAAMGNGQSGIYDYGDNNTIGGASAADRNVIAANTSHGIELGLGSDFAVVSGNYIGTTANGVWPLGNGNNGIFINGDDSLIGGFNINERNIIAANQGSGIKFADVGDPVINNTIINNYIGANKNGNSLGNEYHGVYLSEGSGNTIGSANAPNLIAYNRYIGVLVGENAEENALRVNSIYSNGLLGIDLWEMSALLGSVTLNDNFDSDTGANGLQNYPVLSSASVNGRIQGTLSGAPGNEISLFFYVNESCDWTGYGEGEEFRQAVDVTIPSGGVLLFDLTLAAAIAPGKYVTATAIDIDNENTSEFSNCALVSAEDIVVNVTSDGSDANPGDGLCDTAGPATRCTLRAAIEEVNGLSGAGPFHIRFDIPGAGPHIIAPTTAFDNITKSVIIDGISQPGSRCAIDSTLEFPFNLPADLRIVLDGSNLSGGNGLTLAAGSGGSEVRGLVIGGFPGQGIQIASDSNRVICNHIGIDADGTAAFGNGLNGIRISGIGNVIGGVTSAARNVISGNDIDGIFLYLAAANAIRGNFVGTDAAGQSAIGNGEAGIRLRTATWNLIGGLQSNEANTISGNGLYGIYLRVASNDNNVWGNRIGTNRSGVTAVPNQTGIYVRNSHDNKLGGDSIDKGNLIAGNSLNGLHVDNEATGNLIQYNTVGLNKHGAPLGNGSNGILLDSAVTETDIKANTIAYNGAAGITLLATATQNPIYENSIFANSGLGIDLNGDGLTLNDVTHDPDVGANNLQNFPDMRSANPDSGEISGFMESIPNTKYRLDFYRSDTCDPTEYGEGQEYLGSGLVVTSPSGPRAFSLLLGGFELGDYITATATDSAGNTSEFSICVMAGGSPPVDE